MYNYFINRIKKQLIIGFSNRAGRNFFGRKTIFTQSGGSKFKLRLVDFSRNFTGNNVLLLIEKDVNRTGLLGLLCSSTGLFSYILLSVGNYIEGETTIRGFSASNRTGSSSFLKTIPTGNVISQIEYVPARKCRISRSAGTSSFLVSRDNNYSFVKMNSG
jgi:large subunit ribosomal protein L2